MRASPLAAWLASGDARTDIIQIYYSNATGNDIIWSAEHFSEELRGAGCQVTYTTSGDFEIPLKAWIQAHQITDLRVMAPNDRPFLQLVQNLQLPAK